MPVAGVAAGQAAQRHQARHETEIRVRFAGPDQLVYLIGEGEAPPRRWWGFAERLDRAAQAADDFTYGNQLAALTLHALFSHVPQTRQGHYRRLFPIRHLWDRHHRQRGEDIALLAAGVARGELQVARVILRIQPNPQQPHSATADFDLVRMEMENEVGRERWTLSLQFQFLQQIPTELIVFNPMGIVITYLQGDRATVTGDQ